MDGAFRITSARRSTEEQARLWEAYQAGESELPAAPPGASKHELGLAVDLARPSVDPFEDDLLQQLGEAWKEAGGAWFPSDPVHFEFRPSLAADTGGVPLLSEQEEEGLRRWASGAEIAWDEAKALFWPF